MKTFKTITIFVVMFLFLLIPIMGAESNAKGWTEEGKGWNLTLHNNTDEVQHYIFGWRDHNLKNNPGPWYLAKGELRPGMKTGERLYNEYKPGEYLIGWARLGEHYKVLKFTVKPGTKYILGVPGKIEVDPK